MRPFMELWVKEDPPKIRKEGKNRFLRFEKRSSFGSKARPPLTLKEGQPTSVLFVHIASNIHTFVCMYIFV